MKGGVKHFFHDGTTKFISPIESIRKKNPKARIFGQWIDDVYGPPESRPWHDPMPVGPKPLTVKGYQWGICFGSGGHRVPAGGRCGTYVFEDTPGQESNIGDTNRRRLVLRGVQWLTDFEHKIWFAGKEKPFYKVEFSLRGGMGNARSKGKSRWERLPMRVIKNVQHSRDMSMIS